MNSRRPVNSDVGRLIFSESIMFGMTWNFLNTTLALAIIFALVELVFYFKFKRDKLSAFDKSLRHLWHSSFFIVALLFIAMFFLPLAFYRTIDPAAGQEGAFRDLILNQQRMAEDLRQLREILHIVLFMSALYLGAVATLVRRLYRERRKKDLLNDARLKKPLGLEVN